jgi:hypothetical protein
MMTPNPLEMASIALGQIGLECGMPRVQQGLDHLCSHLDMRAADADEQIAEGQPAEDVLVAGLHDALAGALGARPVYRAPIRLALLLAGIGVMWIESSLTPEPGIGLAIATVLMLASALFPDPERG